MRTIPLFPLTSISHSMSIKLKPVSDILIRIFSSTPKYLNVIGSPIDARSYVGLGLLNSLLIFSMVFFPLTLLSLLKSQLEFLRFTIISSLALFAFSIFYWNSYPFMVAKRKSDLIEKDLLFALRDISVETSGGMSLKESIESVSDGYGELSNEMRSISKEINLGSPVEDALENSIQRNISPIYRSVMVRIIDGIRTGVEISGLLSVVIGNLGEELRNKVKKYGQEINTWITLYLVIGIVLPSMGLTLMIMLSSFSGIVLTETTFYFITFLLIFFHASALSMLKSRRPVLEV